ncbi:unnamed protein product, partial [Coregonus sp. 'balchen']
MVKNDKPVCECTEACIQTPDPVCGSDGHSYGSQCEMRAMGCALQREIHIQHRGPCNEVCANCSFGAICDGQSGRCVCPQECVESHQPVCGSDGSTYDSECELNVRACTKQLDLRVLAQGECKTCGSAVCAWGARCIQNKCECTQCQGQALSPVCGSDGVTYDNTCELGLASCVLKKKIEVAKPSSCDEECGSGGSASGVESCEQDRCRTFGGSWDEDTEDDRCVCDFDCNRVPRNLVCGSDGKTYSNECEMKKDRCERQEHLLIQNQGPCTAISATSLPELTAPQRCSQSVYGCCRDNKTAALGVGLAGCTSTCQCNPYGSYKGTCDPSSGQCSCKPGVGGQKCDRCDPGFWNFRGIVTENLSGCTPCNCDAVGSVRDDCEQMSGLCSCKTGVKGMKCNVCPDGSKMGMNGCDTGADAPTSCDELDCKFGASCVEVNSQAHCECPSPDCDEKNKTKVCGSDGVTYADQCQLSTIACRQDKHITVEHFGQCTESITEPAGRPTPYPPTPRSKATTPSTSHVRLTSPRHGTSRSPWDDDETEGPPASFVEALPPPMDTERALTTNRPVTTPHHTPHSTTTRLPSHTSPGSSPAAFEDSGSGEPSGDDQVEEEEEGSGVRVLEASGEEPVDPTAAATTIPMAEDRSSCDNTPFGCCPDGKTASSSPEGANCPSTMRFNGFLHLDQVEGQEVFYTPEMEDPKSELFGETARSIESAKEFMSVRVRSLAPSNSILAFVEAHFDPETRFMVEDIEGALLKQLKAAKETAIVVKKPEEENIRFNNYGLSILPYFTATTTATATTPTASTATSTTLPPPTSPFIPRRPLGTTRRPYPSRRTTAAPSPVTTTTMAPTPTPTPTITPLHRTRPVPHHTKAQRPCDSHPCRHGGTCEDDGADFSCICPAGRGGAVCEKCEWSPLALFLDRHTHTYKPYFEKEMKMNTILKENSRAYHTVRIAMEFRVAEMTGILLFNGQDGKKDFLSLTLVNGKVELKFNTGSGTGTLVSKVQVKQGRWHQLVVTRNRRNAVLSVDDEPHIEGSSPPGTDGLNLDTNLFIGGVPEDMMTERVRQQPVPAQPLQERRLMPGQGGRDVPLQVRRAPTPTIHASLTDATHHPSVRCNQREGTSASVPWAARDVIVSMTVVLMAIESNGMIFHNGQKTDGKGDFISLSLNDGILEFRYDLGKGPAVIRSKDKVKMGVWNTVNLERASRKGEININGKDPVRGESPNQHTALNLKESLFVGGAPDFSRLARAASLKDGFKGAIQKITLMGTPILRQENALHSSDVAMFEGHPCSREPCHNGGRCNPLLESYECVCLHGFTGTHCQNTIFEKSAGETESIAFDGLTFIEYHNAVTKR